MKKILFVLFFMLIFMLNITSVKAEENYIIDNKASISDWETLNGDNPLLSLNASSEVEGILLGGSSNDVLFDYKFNKEILRNEIMLDFYLDLSNIVYANNPVVSFIFKDEKDVVCSFEFQILEESFNSVVTIGSSKLEYSNMKYKESGHIQFRIAKDEIMNRDTGEYLKAWNLVLGIQKKTVTTKNDSYSIKINKYDDESFTDIDTYLDSLESEYVSLEVKATSTGANDLKLKISQIGTENFYNCYVYSSDYIEFNDINYTGLKMSYTIPETSVNYSGFIIKRYCNGEYDKTYQYSNKYANSLTEKYIKQDSDYTYEVYALEQVSTSNRVACSKIMFKIEAKTCHTLAGNPLRLVVGILVFLALVASFILLYVYRFDISDWFKKVFLRK